MVKSITEVCDDKLIKHIEWGVDLIHKVLMLDGIPEDLRHQLLEWRNDADDLVP